MKGKKSPFMHIPFFLKLIQKDEDSLGWFWKLVGLTQRSFAEIYICGIKWEKMSPWDFCFFYCAWILALTYLSKSRLHNMRSSKSLYIYRKSTGRWNASYYNAKVKTFKVWGFVCFFVFFFPNWVLNTMVKIAHLFFWNG